MTTRMISVLAACTSLHVMGSVMLAQEKTPATEPASAASTSIDALAKLPVFTMREGLPNFGRAVAAKEEIPLWRWRRKVLKRCRVAR